MHAQAAPALKALKIKKEQGPYAARTLRDIEYIWVRVARPYGRVELWPSNRIGRV